MSPRSAGTPLRSPNRQRHHRLEGAGPEFGERREPGLPRERRHRARLDRGQRDRGSGNRQPHVGQPGLELQLARHAVGQDLGPGRPDRGAQRRLQRFLLHGDRVDLELVRLEQREVGRHEASHRVQEAVDVCAGVCVEEGTEHVTHRFTDDADRAADDPADQGELAEPVAQQAAALLVHGVAKRTDDDVPVVGLDADVPLLPEIGLRVDGEDHLPLAVGGERLHVCAGLHGTGVVAVLGDGDRDLRADEGPAGARHTLPQATPGAGSVRTL